MSSELGKHLAIAINRCSAALAVSLFGAQEAKDRVAALMAGELSADEAETTRLGLDLIAAGLIADRGKR